MAFFNFKKKISEMEERIYKKAEKDFKYALRLVAEDCLSSGIEKRMEKKAFREKYGWLADMIEREDEGFINLADSIEDFIHQRVDGLYRRYKEKIRKEAEKRFLQQLEDNQINKLRE